jgi:hypothetical protein
VSPSTGHPHQPRLPTSSRCTPGYQRRAGALLGTGHHGGHEPCGQNPATGVFAGRLTIFTASAASPWWLLVVAAVNTVASAFYYLR